MTAYHVAAWPNGCRDYATGLARARTITVRTLGLGLGGEEKLPTLSQTLARIMSKLESALTETPSEHAFSRAILEAYSLRNIPMVTGFGFNKGEDLKA